MVSRALKKAETRELLIRLARDLFKRRGFEGTTVDDIVGQAGISQRTFFRYFGSKHEVAFPHHKARLDKMTQLIEQHFDAENPVRCVKEALREYSFHYQADRDELIHEFELIKSSPSLLARDMELDSHWEELIATTLRRGGLQPLEAAVLAGAIFGAARASTSHWFSGGCKEDLIPLGQPAIQLIDSLARSFEQKPSIFEGPA